MDEKHLTPWFDGTIKPVRKGVYMLMSGASVGYQKWDGFGWGPWCSDAHHAAKSKKGDYASPQYQNDNWRGLRARSNAELRGRPLADGPA